MVVSCVRDAGEGFEHRNDYCSGIDDVEPQKGSPPVEWIAGFGIMIARGLVDEFCYNDAGNEVTLIKLVTGFVAERGV